MVERETSAKPCFCYSYYSHPLLRGYEVTTNVRGQLADLAYRQENEAARAWPLRKMPYGRRSRRRREGGRRRVAWLADRALTGATCGRQYPCKNILQSRGVTVRACAGQQEDFSSQYGVFAARKRGTHAAWAVAGGLSACSALGGWWLEAVAANDSRCGVNAAGGRSAPVCAATISLLTLVVLPYLVGSYLHRYAILPYKLRGKASPGKNISIACSGWCMTRRRNA